MGLKPIKMVRNECFRVALDYLYKKGFIADQRELSEKIGVSETSISQIINNRIKKPSETTIRKLNEAFGNIFNPEYFRGHSIHLLMEDAVYSSQHPDKDISSISETAQEYNAIPKWADSLIQLVTEQVRTIEGLRREVAALHQEISNLKRT